MEKFEYDDASHIYRLNGIVIPSLTGMLGADGCNEHLERAPADVVARKAEWGTRLAMATQKAEYGFGVDADFKQHCVDWLMCCERMKWGKSGALWKNCEMPALAIVEGMVFGFTPDRAAPQAVVEIKGTYSPHYGHGIQTALQVIGMGYPRSTPRFVAYFDKDGLKRIATCTDSIKRDGRTLNVWDEAERIIFEHARFLWR